MARNLSPSQLFRYPWRVELFLEKYLKEEPFQLMNGSQVELVYSPDIVKLIEAQRIEDLRKPILHGKDSEVYRLGDLEKTKEFGGRGKGAGTVIEDRQIESFQQYELDKPIKIASTYYSVQSLEKTPGTPKSDLHFLSNEKEVVWISHKDGKHPRDFQQFGGLTEAPIISEWETRKFIEDIRQYQPNGLQRATTIARKISNDHLKMKSVYGVDYGKQLGRQNVTLVVQGNLELVSNGGFYSINSNSIHVNGEPMLNRYEPVLMCTYRTDRNQFNVANARFSISPIGGKRISMFV